MKKIILNFAIVLLLISISFNFYLYIEKKELGEQLNSVHSLNEQNINNLSNTASPIIEEAIETEEISKNDYISLKYIFNTIHVNVQTLIRSSNNDFSEGNKSLQSFAKIGDYFFSKELEVNEGNTELDPSGQTYSNLEYALNLISNVRDINNSDKMLIQINKILEQDYRSIEENF